MAGSGAAVQQSISVAGCSSAEVLERVTIAAGADGAFQVTFGGPGTIQLVRTYRPTWATVVGIIGVLLLGLGILAFLVKKTETCTVLVVDGPTGAVVTISGRLLPDQLDRLAAAAMGRTHQPGTTSGGPSEVAAVPAVGPSAAAPASAPEPMLAPVAVPRAPVAPIAGAPWLIDTAGDAELTVARPPARRDTSAAYVLRFDDGGAAEVTGVAYIGRDPAPSRDEGRPHQLVPVVDRSVSKTHLVVRRTDDRLWIEDLHSTNGTVVAAPGSAPFEVSPGAPVAVEHGTVVRFGDRSFEVVAGG